MESVFFFLESSEIYAKKLSSKLQQKKNVCANFDDFFFAYVSDDSKKIRKK